jgi:Xaa-Pro dipeptidase
MNQIRKKLVNEIMQTQEIGTLVFWRPEELVMMLGYYPLWGLSFLIYTDDEKPVLFVPQAEPDDILPSGVEIKRFPWGILSPVNPWDVLFEEIRQLLKEKNIFDKKISYIGERGGTTPCRMSGEAPLLPESLITSLLKINNGNFKEIDQQLLGLFEFKTEDDLKGIRLAHKVVGQAVEVFIKNAVPGMTEAKLAALIEFEIALAMEDNAILSSKGWPQIQSGVNLVYGGRFNRTTGKIINNGDHVMLEMATCVNGYWVDITRTVQVGETNDTQKEIFKIVSEAQQLAIQAIRPGILMKDIDAIARTHIENAGYGKYFNHALGHHVGFRYHDTGQGFSPYSLGVLKEGMVLTVEPGIYGEELKSGVRIEDNLLVTKDGYDLLSNY